MKIALIAACAITLTAPMLAFAQDDVVASVGDASVTGPELTQILKNIQPQARAQLAANPKELDVLVHERLAASAVINEAKAKGWDKQDKVKGMIDEAVRETIVASYLQSVAEPPADFPSDQDMQAAYDKNKGAFDVPAAVHVSQIFIAAPASADKATIDQARSKANDLANQAHAANADFAALAKANSQDQASAGKGGDMGFVPSTALVPEIRKATESLKVGEVSKPIQTPTGFHIVKLIETRPASTRSFAESKEQIRAAMRQQRTQQNAVAYLAKAGGGNTVAINEDAVRKALSAAQ
ncbi:Peptidylprolyl isomerase [Pararobbsia alpina]|uniref:peptidylprolyl isomerase n=1 Tax=Pararobbsia alpina TaxID=621374 RepID=UPI0039A6A9C3